MAPENRENRNGNSNNLSTVINSKFIIITEIITQTGITIYGGFPATQIGLTEIAEIYPNFTVRVPSEK